MLAFPDETFNDLFRTWPDKAITYIYDHYYKELVHIAERRTSDRNAAEDIVQDVLVEFWKKSKEIRMRKGFLIGPYLIYLVKNRSINFYNQRSREVKDPSILLGELVSTNITKESELVLADKYKTLKDIVSRMPARERACIELRYFHEMSVESIARKLGVTSKAVEKNITKGLKRLRKHRSIVY